MTDDFHTLLPTVGFISDVDHLSHNLRDGNAFVIGDLVKLLAMFWIQTYVKSLSGYSPDSSKLQAFVYTQIFCT